MGDTMKCIDVDSVHEAIANPKDKLSCPGAATACDIAGEKIEKHRDTLLLIRFLLFRFNQCLNI